MKDVECPYCGTAQDIRHDDGQEYDEGLFHEQQCRDCEKTFAYTIIVIYQYEVSNLFTPQFRQSALNNRKGAESICETCGEYVHAHCGGRPCDPVEKWRSVDSETPDEGEVVVCQCGERAFLGGYCWIPDGEYWAWGILAGHVWWNGTHWDGDIEVDDQYDVTAWHKLPQPR